MRVIFQWLVEFRGGARILLVERTAMHDTGVRRFVETLNTPALQYSDELAQDRAGQDRLDSLFTIALAHRGNSRALMMLNSDCFVGPDFPAILEATIPKHGDFLITGVRFVFPEHDQLEFNPLNQSIAEYAAEHILSPGPKRYNPIRHDMLDFFAFREKYRFVPPFRIGKSVWDNWLFAEAHDRLKWTTISGGIEEPVLYLVHPGESCFLFFVLFILRLTHSAEHQRPHQFVGAEKLHPGQHNRHLAYLYGGLGGGGVASRSNQMLRWCDDGGVCIGNTTILSGEDLRESRKRK